MKALHGSAGADVAAPLERCLALLSDLERYPAWYPEVVREVVVQESHPEGLAKTARARLHVSYGPLARDLELLLSVSLRRPATVVLARVPHSPQDHEAFEVRWTLAPGAAMTSVRLELDAVLDVPRLVPLAGAGETLAAGFLRAAVAALA